MTVARNPAVAPAEKIHDRRDTAELPERPGPPEVPGDSPQGVRPAENHSARFQQPHFRQQFGIRQPQPPPDPGRLQRQQFKSPADERLPATPRQPDTIMAPGVVKHPAFKFVLFGNFSIHRNSTPKMGGQPPNPSTLKTRSPSFTNRTRALTGHWRIWTYQAEVVSKNSRRSRSRSVV